ncbi:hypothetical protein CYMTET_49094 [Cymbomonas tetramitiformis]|uniref:AB hydrolase-1 domain-containing protein n=1 Tax=Cymbomonas tetramitiformis TaxID=36881 RepID=A0AAE0BSJ9_9CHLO|nr:hypothetical protein CYMTET_49094 [Cymbomonas tetramitiformis]
MGSPEKKSGGRLKYVFIVLVAVGMKILNSAVLVEPLKSVAVGNIVEPPELQNVTSGLTMVMKALGAKAEFLAWAKIRVKYKKEGSGFMSRVFGEALRANWYMLTQMKTLPRVAEGDVEVMQESGKEVVHHFITERSTGVSHSWHYYEAGPKDGEVVVFLHGMLQTTYCFYHQFDNLLKGGKKYRLINFDIKGFGHSSTYAGNYMWSSTADQFMNIIDQLGIEKLNLVCHDRGCLMGDYMVRRHNERFLRYIRAQQFLDFVELDRSPQGKSFSTTEGCYTIGRPTKIAFAFSFATYNQLPLPELVRSIQEHMLNPYGGCRYFASSPFEKDVSDREGPNGLLANINVPVLGLWGDRDLGQPRYYYDTTAWEKFPNFRLAFIPDTSHFTSIENPKVFSDLVESFLNVPIDELWKQKPTNWKEAYFPGGSFDPNVEPNNPEIPMGVMNIFPTFQGNYTEWNS